MRLLGGRGPNVAKLKRRGDLPGIRSALRYEKVEIDAEQSEWDRGADVRLEAVEALSSFYGPVVGEGLAEALHDDAPQVRLAAVKGLADLGSATVVDALVERVIVWEEPADAEAARIALDILVGLSVEGLPELFVERLTLSRMPEPAERHRSDLDELLVADPRGDDAAAALASALVSIAMIGPEPERELRAETVLGWLGGSLVIEVLVAALEDGSAKPGVIRALGRLGDSAAVEPLLGVIGEPDPLHREAAVVALGALRDTRAVPRLLGATRDGSRDVRDAAIRALDDMGTAAVIVGVATLVGSGADRLEGEWPRATWVEDLRSVLSTPIGEEDEPERAEVRIRDRSRPQGTRPGSGIFGRMGFGRG